MAGAKVENQPPRKLGLGKKVSAKLGHRLAGGQMNFFPQLSLGWGGGKKTKRKARVGLLQLSRRWHNLKVMSRLVGRWGPKKRKIL